jgi:hypothetical protein
MFFLLDVLQFLQHVSCSWSPHSSSPMTVTSIDSNWWSTITLQFPQRCGLGKWLPFYNLTCHASAYSDTSSPVCGSKTDTTPVLCLLTWLFDSTHLNTEEQARDMGVALSVCIPHQDKSAETRQSQWRTVVGFGGVNPPLKFWSFDKAEPNTQFHGKYNHYNIITIRISLICKLSGTPE